MNIKKHLSRGLLITALMGACTGTVAAPYAEDSNGLQVPAEANLVSPSAIDTNSRGDIVVSSRGAKKIMVFNRHGKFLRGLGDGIVAAPHGLRVDQQDNIWISDIEQHVVLKLSPKGRVLMVLGQQNNAGEFDEQRKMAQFFKPADIAFGADGDIYVADGYGNTRIVHFDKDGNMLRSWGVAGSGPNQFNNPHNIVVADGGKVFVADRHNKRIQIFSPEGELIKIWDHLGTPWGLDASADKLYLTDGNKEQVMVLDFDGKVLETFGSPGETLGKFRAAHGIAVDAKHNIWVTEILNWRVQKFSQ